MDTEKSYLEDELELEVPKNGLKTMKRMWDSAPEQHLRLLLVMISVVCYTLFSIVSPLYSAHLVDLIWNGVKESAAQGTVFSFSWARGGRELLILFLLYFFCNVII